MGQLAALSMLVGKVLAWTAKYLNIELVKLIENKKSSQVILKKF